MGVSVDEILSLEVMKDVKVVAGRAGLDRSVEWVAVIEWPVEDFVRPGELVLTSGISCDDQMLAQLVQEVMAAGAAAVCIGVGDSRYVASIGAEVQVLADQAGIPVIQLPWALRFADITRAVVDRVLAERYATPDGPGSMQQLFSSLALDGGAGEAIAKALETAIHLPVVLLDQEFYRYALGPMAEEQLGTEVLDDFSEAIDALSAAQFLELERSLGGRAVTETHLPGLPPAHSLAIVVGQRAAGYLLVITEDYVDTMPAIEAKIMEHAALALATDALRMRSALEAEMRIQGHFLWAVASGAIADPAEVRTKAALLGYQSRTPLGTIVVRSSGPAEAEDVLDATRRAALRLGRLHDIPVAGSRRGKELLLVVEVDRLNMRCDSLAQFGRILQSGVAENGLSPVSIGLSAHHRPLADLAASFEEAQQILQIGICILGEGEMAEPRALEPFLIVSRLAGDAETQRLAAEVVAPLVEYDRGSKSGLMHTLKIFLNTNGNASSAARLLFLNRHSLLYRLRKIESLTGRSLESNADRFVLDLSMKLRRFAAFDEDASGDH